MAKRTSNKNAVPYIAQRISFQGSSFAGIYSSGPGWLGGSDRERFNDDEPFIDYVVVSYATPIAWHVRSADNKYGRWVMPATKYSVTTTRHQSIVRLSLRDEEVEEI